MNDHLEADFREPDRGREKRALLSAAGVGHGDLGRHVGGEMVEGALVEAREVEAAAEGEATEAAGGRGASFVAAMGGSTNLSEIAACTTRLRLIVVDPAQVDEPALKRLGARGILRPSASGVQVVLGPVADTVAMEMRAAIETGPIAATAPRGASVATSSVQAAHAPAAVDASLPDVLVRAMGGADNILSASRHAGRWRVALVDPSLHTAAPGEEARAIAHVGPNIVHVLID